MFKKFFNKLLDINQKEIDRLQKIVDKINSFEEDYKQFKNTEFEKQTHLFRKSLEDGQGLDDILPQAFALVREAADRTLGLRPYDVQLMASIALFEGMVVEQKTGEGKTLSAVPALYLRALENKGVHLVTVNDYLARRDAGWNAPIFKLLGLSVGVITQEQKSYVYDTAYSDKSHGDERLEHLKPVERVFAYGADVTYGTNNEFGFDYLRDNMVARANQMVQSGGRTNTQGKVDYHHFAIVDEVDSVLIDEARTPLIISAPDTDPTDKYYKFAEIIKKLDGDTDYVIDEKAKSAALTEHGITRVEKILGVDNLYESDFSAIHHIENALKARTLFLQDRDYVVKDNAVTIVDEFTGRLMIGRRWSDGLHQAVEAKEGVVIQQESKTLATISFQNYFRLYTHLSGMTGTAATESEEFEKIYKLKVIVVPTNVEIQRTDYSDVVYKTLRAKYGAIVNEIDKRRKAGQPVLVGTTSIEKNEIISSYLKHKKVPHNILNAKNHEKEAMIIADAGKPGAGTVATNMAGRGVDIVLGGSQPETPPGVEIDDYKKSNEFKKWIELHNQVIKAGGLHVIGTERHESRRIDNQLRGRAGRQGDPGSSRFYLSLEDDLMRIFGGDQIKSLMDRLNLPEDQPIENALISRAIEQAQTKVEGHNFDMRKNTVEYDDVANQQREIIYKQRRKALENASLKEEIKEKIYHHLAKVTDFAWPQGESNLDQDKLMGSLMEVVPFDEKSRERIKDELRKVATREDLEGLLKQIIDDVGTAREKQLGSEVIREIEKFAYLGSIDHLWIDHIDQIDGLREGVRLRGYAQRDPLSEFKNEAFTLFEKLLGNIDEELVRRIFRIQVARPTNEIPLSMARTNEDQLDATGLAGNADTTAKQGEKAFKPRTNTDSPKTGRNDPCPCGSGLKWKKCGLINAPQHKS